MGCCTSCVWVGRSKLTWVVNPMIVYECVMSKWKKNLLGQKWGTFLRISRLWPIASSDLNFFLKMFKLDEKESLDPKMSDFEWFGEFFNFSMFNTFSWLYHSLLISEGNSCPILMFDHSIWSLWPALQEYGATRGPIRHQKKWQKHVWKLSTSAIFGHIFAIFWVL